MPGQYFLARQLCAIPRHAHNKVLRAPILIDNAFPVPRRDNRILHTRLALRPLKTVLVMSILCSVFRRKRTHVVGDPEGNQAFYLVCLLFKEGIETTLIFKNRLQLFQVQLIVDCPVITRLQATQETLLLKRIHHGDIALIVLSTCAL